MKKWLVHNDYDPLGVYICDTKEEAIEKFKEHAIKCKITYDNKNLNAELMV